MCISNGISNGISTSNIQFQCWGNRLFSGGSRGGGFFGFHGNPLSNFKIQDCFFIKSMCHAHQHVVITTVVGALLLREALPITVVVRTAVKSSFLTFFSYWREMFLDWKGVDLLILFSRNTWTLNAMVI